MRGITRSVAVAVVLLGTVSSAGAETGPGPSTVPELLKTFGVQNQSADFVVVVDTSASMAQGPTPQYPGVVRAYQQFVQAAPAGDNLSVITFDTAANLVVAGSVSDATRAQMAGALPAEPKGQHTDIGAAIASAEARLERPDANPVQILLVLTDGKNDPAATSPYPAAFGGFSWRSLQDRAAALAQSRSVAVYGDGLGGKDATDIALLQRVFPTTTLLGLPASELKSFFDEAITRARVEQLRAPVSKELDQGYLTVEIDDRGDLKPGSTTLTARLRSEYQHLPVTITVNTVTVTQGGKPLTADVDGAPLRLTIPPMGTSPPFRIRVDTTVSTLPWWRPAKTVSQDFAVQLSGSGQVQPADLLTRSLGGGLPIAVAKTRTGTGEAALTTGLTFRRFLELLAATLASVAALLALYWRFIWLPNLRGGLVEYGSGLAIPLKGKRMTVPGPRAEIPRTRGASVVLFTRRGNPGRVFVGDAEGDTRLGPSEDVLAEMVGSRRLRVLDVLALGQARLRWVKHRPIAERTKS